MRVTSLRRAGRAALAPTPGDPGEGATARPGSPGPGRPGHLRLPRSLAGQIFAMQAVVVAAIVAGCAVLAYVEDRDQADETARRQVLATAHAVADAPSVRDAIRTKDPTGPLQPYALRVGHDSGVDFVTIMNTRGIRWTHPDPRQIGRPFLGTTAPALHGRTFTETYTGTLGPSIRAVTPVRDGARITGLVSVGITVRHISGQLAAQVKELALAASGALALGALGTYVVAARLRRQTHGMNAAELGRMHDYHEAALHAVHEGLLMLDGAPGGRRIALVNDGGRELLGLEGPLVGRRVDALGLPPPLTAALLSPEPRVDEVHLTRERMVVVNTRPVVGGERHGTVVTLRDRTELQALAGELDSERGFSQALRAQAHEASNRLHTVVSLIELGRVAEAVEFATAELELAQALTDQVVGAVGEPVLAALLLGKAAQAHERGVELVLSPESRIDDGVLPASLPARDLVTVLGNLVDNAVEAAQGAGERPRVTVTALAAGGELLLRVGDTGPGVRPGALDEVFTRGWSTRGPGRGLGLALVRQAVHRARGTVRIGVPPGQTTGSEFTVRLPLGDGPADRGGTARARERAGSPAGAP